MTAHQDTAPRGAGTQAGGGHPVVPFVVGIDGIPMSGLVAEAPHPRAVVLALHGGATDSIYFDCPGEPRLSLLRTAPMLGFTAIALDRPGYGASAAHADELTSADGRVDLAYATMDRLLADCPTGVGVFILAHSAGSDLAVRMAVRERGAELLGLEVAGTGRRHHPDMQELIGERRDNRSWPKTKGPGLRDFLWEPADLYPPTIVGGARIGGPTPDYERDVGRRWQAELPALAAGVRVPVRFSLGDTERVWPSGPETLADFAALFTASPRVVVNQQAHSGHNLSIGWTAMAYHLQALAFVEECVVERRRRLA